MLDYMKSSYNYSILVHPPFLPLGKQVELKNSSFEPVNDNSLSLNEKLLRRLLRLQIANRFRINDHR